MFEAPNKVAGWREHIEISKPGAINAVKTIKLRPSKKPLITTKCQPPGAKSPVAC